MATMQAQALYNFEGGSPEELTFVADEYLTIVNQDVGEGWWEARNNRGQSGLIPKDYVEVVTDSLPEPSMPPPPLPSQPVSSWNAPAVQVQQPPAWNQPARVQSSFTPANHQSSWNSQPSAPPQVQDGDDWDDDWDDDDDDGSSVATEQNSMGDAHLRPAGVSRVRESNASTKSGKTISRLSNYNKLGFDSYLLSKDAQQVPDVEKIKIIETNRGWEWEQNPEVFTCLVDSPKKSSKMKGLKSFITYQLTPSFSNIVVQRRYKHFDWLHERFSDKYPTVVIPPLPDKQISGRYEDDFINERMRQLQEWVTRVCTHPVVSRSSVWKHFLTCTDEKTWKRGKREAEHDKYRGGKFFHTIITPPSPLDPAKVEQDIDNFTKFADKMDHGVKTMMNVATDQIKKYPFQFRREYKKIADSVNIIQEAFTADGCSDSGNLNAAMADTGKAYEDIATMFQQQPRQDWIPMLESLHVYRGLLGGFDGTMGAQKHASGKVKESQRMQEEGKVTEAEFQAVSSHADAISYSLYAEVNHFHQNRQQEFKIMMQNFLAEQIDFHNRITARLEKAKAYYDKA